MSESSVHHRATLGTNVGLPIRIGLGPTKVLSKLANHLAKKNPIFDGVCDLHDQSVRQFVLPLVPVQDLWGVAGATASKLYPLGIRTAADLVAFDPATARSVGTVVLERLMRELGGLACDQIVEETKPLQNTAVTRCFGAAVTDLETLTEALIRHAVRAAEKIRAQDLVACRMIVFAHNFKFRAGPKYSRTLTARLSPATNDPRILAGHATRWRAASISRA